jgi:hypothetical protein
MNNKTIKKRAGTVAPGVGPEFKPQQQNPQKIRDTFYIYRKLSMLANMLSKTERAASFLLVRKLPWIQRDTVIVLFL